MLIGKCLLFTYNPILVLARLQAVLDKFLVACFARRTGLTVLGLPCLQPRYDLCRIAEASKLRTSPLLLRLLRDIGLSYCRRVLYGIRKCFRGGSARRSRSHECLDSEGLPKISASW